MRNIFDQYVQPENRLTHALLCTLDNDRSLLVPFLRWLGIRDIPKSRSLRLVEQQVPGSPHSGDDEARGVPDACVYNDDGWAVLFESKIQAPVSNLQLRRHLLTAERHGYKTPRLVVLTDDGPKVRLIDEALDIRWRDVYSWFGHRDSPWAKQLVNYMNKLESDLIAKAESYTIRGTITMFDGLKFGPDNPYTYREGKRCIKLLGDELQKRSDLEKRVGMDPNGDRRSAITGRGSQAVWDFLPLKIASNANSFTHFPHLTISINSKHAIAALTIPNSIRGGLKSRLRTIGIDEFGATIANLEQRLRRVIRRSHDSKPVAYVTQRHFQSQRSSGIEDGRLEFDLRTIRKSSKSAVRYQPQWLDALFDLLINRRSNMQFGIEVRFSYDCPIVRSSAASSLFAETWIALAPLIVFVTSE